MDVENPLNISLILITLSNISNYHLIKFFYKVYQEIRILDSAILRIVN
jgi:hypothetical protein